MRLVSAQIGRKETDCSVISIMADDDTRYRVRFYKGEPTDAQRLGKSWRTVWCAMRPPGDKMRVVIDEAFKYLRSQSDASDVTPGK